MSQLDPIELEVLLNSTAVAHQSNQLKASLRGVDSSILATEKRFNALTQSQLSAVGSSNALTQSFKTMTSAAVAYFSMNTATGFVGDLIQIRGEYQKTEIAFKTMLGSQEQANELMKQSIDLAAKSPFNMREVAEGAKQLLAFDIPANEVIDTLRRMGDISAGVKKPLSQIQLVFGQVGAKGKLMGDDLRQFTEAGIPMVKELAEKFNVTTGEIYQMVSAGKVGFNDVKEVLFNLTNEGGRFYNLMEEQSKSLAGQYANLEDAIEQMFNKMGKSSEGVLSSGLSSVTFLVEHYSELLDVLGGIITMYGSYKAAVMLVSATESVRNKMLVSEIQHLSISEKMKLGRALVTQKQAQATLAEAQAEQTATQAKYQSLQAEVALLDIKKSKAVALATEKAQILQNAAAQLSVAQTELAALGTTATAREISIATKKVESLQNQVLAAQETAEITRKKALATSQEFYTAKTHLNTTAKALNANATKVGNAQEALSVATKNANTIATTKLTIAQSLAVHWTKLYAKAQALLNATMLTNPIVLMIAAVGGLTYAYVNLSDSTTEAERLEKKLKEQREAHAKALDELKSKAEQYLAVVRDENATKLQRYEAYQKLQALYPQLLKNIELETFLLMEQAEVQKLLSKGQDEERKSLNTNEITQAREQIGQLKKEIETLEASAKYAGQGAVGIWQTIAKKNEQLKLTQGVLEKNLATQKEITVKEKIANMSLEERKAYYERIAHNTEAVLSQKKNINGEVKKTIGLSDEVRKALQNWSIDKLNHTLNYAINQINSINKAVGDASKSAADKNKADWEAQMKDAKDKLDAMGIGKKGSAEWNEQVKLYQEAEAQISKFDYSAKKAIATQNKLAKQSAKTAETLAKKQKDFIKEIQEAERDLAISRMKNNDREIANVEDKYKKLREKAKELKLSESQIAKIDDLQKIELEVVGYKQDTDKLLKELGEEKELYAAYEAFKTQVGKEEADKRFAIAEREFQNFGERLHAEIDKLNQLSTLTPEQTERKEKLTEQKKDYDKNQSEKEREKYAEAYNALLSFDDKRRAIEQKYQEDKKQLELTTDPIIREAKLQELEFQKKAALDAINAEAYERSLVYEKMSENLLGITRRELKNRIASLEEYLEKAKDNLSEEQKAFIQNELEKAKAVKSSTDLGVEEKVLLRQKEEILKRITDLQNKGIANVSEEMKELDAVNAKLKDILAKKFAKVSEVAGQLGSSFSELGRSLKDYDEGLGDTVETMGELLNIAGEVSGAVASFASEDIVGGITKTIKAITSIFSIGAKARESERKAREQIKKYHDEIFQSQLNYNAELRKRVAEEVKLNDLYKSRVTNIKEEMEANKKNAQNVIRDQKEVFKRLLHAQTVVGMTTEKYGGFLGIGRKTRAVEIKKSVAELLGAGKHLERSWKFGYFRLNQKIFKPEEIELTDEIFDKLEKLNGQKPLTGDAKTAYEQLKKLRDEYGSIEKAQRELEKQFKDAITGTTADSLAESIRQGIASGKKAFADFADDIEGFLRNAVLAGLETDVFREKTQKLQDALADMMKDGVISPEEREQFNKLYMAIVEESRQKLELINQAGLKVVKEQESANSLQGALKGMSQESADILGGHLAGLRLYVMDIYNLMKTTGSGMMERLSKMLEIQMNIEKNTRRTAENTDKLHDINEGIGKVEKAISSGSNATKASGLKVN